RFFIKHHFPNNLHSTHSLAWFSIKGIPYKSTNIMNTTKLLSALTLSCVVIACSKDKSTSLNDPSFSASSFSELNVSKDFNWSSSVKGNFTVVLDAPSDLHTENQSIELQDADGNILQIAEVRGGQASFNIVVP